MDNNTFGKLIRSYRVQRGWKQGDLAERWGFTREYVSQIERGERKLDKLEQVLRLADILGIPEEKLAAAGKGFPSRKTSPPPSLRDDDRLLEVLLEPAQNTVKMSWLVWKGDGAEVDMRGSLTDLAQKLDSALDAYHGQFRKSALRLLAYTHEMLGRLAIEHVQTQQAIAHFQLMHDLAEEVGDIDIMTLALVHQSEMFRRRGWYEASLRRMLTAEKYIRDQEVSKHIQGVLWKAAAINHFTYGNEQDFVRTIDFAVEIAEDTALTVDTLSADFDKLEVQQTRAQGYTMLHQPEKALAIYKQTDKLRPFRPLRDQASYAIVKAQAHCHAGDTKTGIRFALQGMKMAESFHSTRYVIRLLQMSDRLKNTPIGQERVMIDLREEILSTLRRMND